MTETEKKIDSDPVNSPSHYTSGQIEVIEFIEDQGLGPGFHIGNAIKYAARAGKKDPAKTVGDLQKVGWYISRWIEVLEAKREGRAPCKPKDTGQKSQLSAGVDFAARLKKHSVCEHGWQDHFFQPCPKCQESQAREKSLLCEPLWCEHGASYADSCPYCNREKPSGGYCHHYMPLGADCRHCRKETIHAP